MNEYGYSSEESDFSEHLTVDFVLFFRCNNCFHVKPFSGLSCSCGVRGFTCEAGVSFPLPSFCSPPSPSVSVLWRNTAQQLLGANCVDHRHRQYSMEAWSPSVALHGRAVDSRGGKPSSLCVSSSLLYGADQEQNSNLTFSLPWTLKTFPDLMSAKLGSISERFHKLPETAPPSGDQLSVQAQECVENPLHQTTASHCLALEAHCGYLIFQGIPVHLQTSKVSSDTLGNLLAPTPRSQTHHILQI